MNFEELLRLPANGLEQSRKEAVLLDSLNELTEWHRARCDNYRRLLDVMWPGKPQTLAEAPYIPVAVFKTHRLISIPDSEIAVTLTSSGTTGQQVSRIYLDRITAQRQTLALGHVMGSLLGPQRLPMMLIESSAFMKDRSQFSARGAGVLGMMNFGRRHFWALDENMGLDVAGVEAFLRSFGQAPFLIFGFTYMVWQYFYKQIASSGLDFSNGILVHSGGWKKLQDEAVGNPEFKRLLLTSTGLRRVHNFYGMVEQVGGVFLEGEGGYLHTNNFSDVVVRNPLTWREAALGEPGVIQSLSCLPLSYPGHSILTEDIGVVHGIDDPECGPRGKRFSVIGRVPKAELRGCSDTHAYGVRSA